MLKDLLKKIDYFWFFIILTAILCFGFFLTNPTMGIDDNILKDFFNFEYAININRLMQYFIGYFVGSYEFIPFFNDFIGIFIYIIAIVYSADNFMKYAYNFDKKQAIIFSTVSMSFPFIIFALVFQMISISLPIGILLSAVGVNYTFKYLYEKPSKIYLLYSIISLFVALSIYETCILYYLIASLFILYSHLVWDNTEVKSKSGSSFIAIFNTVCISFIINNLIIKLIKIVMQIEYNRINYYLKYDLSSLKSFVISFYSLSSEFIKEFCSNVIPFTSKTGCNIACTVSVFCILTFLIISVIFSVKKKRISILFYSLCIILIPFTSFLVTGKTNIPYRTFISLGFLNAITIVILYSLIKNRQVLLKIFFILVSFIVFYQAKEINQILYTENMKFENDKIFAHMLMYDLEKMNLQDKPIVFVGLKENPKLEHEYYGQADDISTSTFNWDRNRTIYFELFSSRPHKFIRAQGYRIIDFLDSELYNNEKLSTDDIQNAIENVIKDMRKKVQLKIWMNL